MAIIIKLVHFEKRKCNLVICKNGYNIKMEDFVYGFIRMKTNTVFIWWQ